MHANLQTLCFERSASGREEQASNKDCRSVRSKVCLIYHRTLLSLMSGFRHCRSSIC